MQLSFPLWTLSLRIGNEPYLFYLIDTNVVLKAGREGLHGRANEEESASGAHVDLWGDRCGWVCGRSSHTGIGKDKNLEEEK